MKTAFSPDVSRTEGCYANGIPQFYMPARACGSCVGMWRTLGRVPPICPSPWQEPELWFPSLSVDPRADLRKFKFNREVSLAEFETLRSRLVGNPNTRSLVLPGSGIGPVRVRLRKNAPDFVACSFKWLASKRAIEVLLQHDIKLPYGPARVRLGSIETTDTYVAVELAPIRLLSEETLRQETIVFCPRCGNYWMEDVRAKCLGPRQIVQERIPEEQGFVRMYEGIATIATERAMSVIKENRLTGLVFEPFGVYG